MVINNHNTPVASSFYSRTGLSTIHYYKALLNHLPNLISLKIFQKVFAISTPSLNKSNKTENSKTFHVKIKIKNVHFLPE